MPFDDSLDFFDLPCAASASFFLSAADFLASFFASPPPAGLAFRIPLTIL